MLDQERGMSNEYKYETKTVEWADDDWGLIISNDGSLRGLYIPPGFEDEEVPHSIVVICNKYFGVDPNDATEDLIKQPMVSMAIH
jgi:hypothetical protein|tara:strand:+ start:15310 stop:15564 length:255 start_codon:yes stop_codon:yes gene_type:complete